MPNAAGEIC